MPGTVDHRPAAGALVGLGMLAFLGMQGCTADGPFGGSSPVPLDQVTPTTAPGTQAGSAPASDAPSSGIRSSTRQPAPGSSPRSAPVTDRTPLEAAEDFIDRIPAEIRRGGCEPAVTTDPAVPYVTCEHPSSGRSIVYRIYSDKADMDANFQDNLYDDVPADTSDCRTPRHTSTYRLGTHQGRMHCAIETTGGTGIILSTDDSTLVVTNVTPGEAGKTDYSGGYRLWRVALQVLPA